MTYSIYSVIYIIIYIYVYYDNINIYIYIITYVLAISWNRTENNRTKSAWNPYFSCWIQLKGLFVQGHKAAKRLATPVRGFSPQSSTKRTASWWLPSKNCWIYGWFKDVIPLKNMERTGNLTYPYLSTYYSISVKRVGVSPQNSAMCYQNATPLENLPGWTDRVNWPPTAPHQDDCASGVGAVKAENL